jgi:hypothetical protein
LVMSCLRPRFHPPHIPTGVHSGVRLYPYLKLVPRGAKIKVIDHKAAPPPPVAFRFDRTGARCYACSSGKVIRVEVEVAVRKIGYFTCLESGGHYLGAVLVTDGAGIPLEFKYTEPIKPTRIQAILYGGSLERYIKTEVIRAKLVKSLTNRPEVIFIDNTDMSMLGRCEGIPVIALQQARIQPLEKPGEVKRPKENELIVQLQTGADPLRLVFGETDEELITRFQNLVIELGQSMDMVEPMQRSVTALEAIIKQGPGKAV